MHNITACFCPPEKKKEFFDNTLDSLPEQIVFVMMIMGEKFLEPTFSNPSVQKLINDPNEKFDLVIVEQFIIDAIKGFGYHYKAPLVALSTMGAGALTNDIVANPSPRSYIPDLFLNYGVKMTFWQRLRNGWFGVLEDVLKYYVYYPRMNGLVQRFFPGAPSVEELNANVSLVLLNSHVSTNQPVPHVPNMIEIGGFHVYPPKKLPQDLQKYLDDAKEGVVYFSMGSNLKSKYLPIEKKNQILRAFSKVNLKVLWKFEDDTLTGVPKNVRLIKWAPQQEILGARPVFLI